MKILVIGNGFDLEHGLPTKYKDFLEFIQAINWIIENWDQNKKINERYFCYQIKEKMHYEVNTHIKKYFYDNNILNSFYKWSKKDKNKELIECANNNIWIKYFINNANYEKYGWIDLESEISNVIQSVDIHRKYEINPEIKNEKQVSINKSEKETFNKILELINALIKDGIINNTDNDLFELIIKTFKNHLNNLIRCLEIYLEDCVAQINISYISPDIKDIYFDKVLSFNYTNTYERKYGLDFDYDSERYDYIHGKANIDRRKEKNNMVLGIDEYLDDDRKSKELEFIEFKKYFQRIHKRTGKNYKKWICEREEKDENKIYIFGHSLDVTDKDILKELIEFENTITTIFYCNKSVYAQQIANLVKIIGPDELTRKVSGENPTIIFKQQQVKRKNNYKDLVEEQLYYLVMSCIHKNSEGLTIVEIEKELKENIELIYELDKKVDFLKTLNELRDFGALVYNEAQGMWIKADNFDVCFEDSIRLICELFEIEVRYEDEKYYNLEMFNSNTYNIFSEANSLDFIIFMKEFEVLD